MDPLEFPFDEPDKNLQDFALRRLRFMAQQRIPGPDLRAMVHMDAHMGAELPFLERQLSDLVVRVVGTVYAEDLPPEKIERTTTVTCHGVATAHFRVPDGPWMRWREHHETSRWYRLLFGWLPPIRRIHHTASVPWSTTREVTCQIDLGRYYVYPESRIGVHPGLGPVRIAKHTINAFWTDREVPAP